MKNTNIEIEILIQYNSNVTLIVTKNILCIIEKVYIHRYLVGTGHTKENGYRKKLIGTVKMVTHLNCNLLFPGFACTAVGRIKVINSKIYRFKLI